MMEYCKTCTRRENYETDFISRPVDVLIAGAQKAGTTSLLHYLRQHDQVAGHDQIELAYFVQDDQYERGYDNIFPEYYPESVDLDCALLGKAVAVMYIGEALKRLYHHNPQCKIVVVLRDPIDRAYSAYWYARKIGWETASSFEEGLSLENERLQNRSELARHCGYVDRGLYDEQIRALYDYFGKDQVLPIVFEEFVQEPVKHCKKVFDFIGLDPYDISVDQVYNKGKAVRYEWLSQILTHIQRNSVVQEVRYAMQFTNIQMYIGRLLRWIKECNEREFTPPPISQKTKRRLTNEFKPHIQRAMELTDLNLEHWLPTHQ